MVGAETVGEVLVVEEGGKAVTTEERLASVLELRKKVEGDLIVVLSTRLVIGKDKGEDSITVGVDEIKVPKVVTIAFVEVLALVKGSVLDSPDEVGVVNIVEMDVEV